MQGTEIDAGREKEPKNNFSALGTQLFSSESQKHDPVLQRATDIFIIVLILSFLEYLLSLSLPLTGDCESTL